MKSCDSRKSTAALFRELCARTRIKYRDLPDLLLAQHWCLDEELRTRIESRTAELTRRSSECRTRFASGLSEAVRKTERLLSQQLAQLLRGDTEKSKATDSKKVKRELASLIDRTKRELYSNRNGVCFLENFAAAFRSRQLSEEKEYARKYYELLKIGEIEEELFRNLATPYTVRLDHNTVLSEPIVDKDFPCYFLG